MQQMKALKADSLRIGERLLTQRTVRVEVTVRQPLQVTLNDAVVMILNQTMLADIHSVLETEQIRHLLPGTFTQTHRIST